jgi:YaiO family outer membrane protein
VDILGELYTFTFLKVAMRFCMLFFFLAILANPCFSQGIAETNPDKLLENALREYKKGNYERSVEYASRGLEIAPSYHDLRIILVKSLFALEEYENADQQLLFLLENAAKYPGVQSLTYQSLGSGEALSEKLEKLDVYLKIYPADLHLKIIKASLLLDAGNKKVARELASKLLNKEKLPPGDRYQLQNIFKRSLVNQVGANYQVYGFSEKYTREHPWHWISLEYLRNIGKTSVIGRVSYMNRGYVDGTLYELDAYPVFNEKTYAHANIGFSNWRVFPKFQGKASVFRNFAKKFEAQIGTRYLYAGNTAYLSGIFGLTLYQGRFYLNAKSFLGPDTSKDFIQNYQFNLRYYFGDADNYVFGRLGYGTSPDEGLVFTNLPELRESMDAYSVSLGLNKSVGIQHVFKVSLGYLQAETETNSAHQVIGAVGYFFRF